MSARPRVLITDHPSPDAELELDLLARNDLEGVVAQTGDESELIELARGAIGIMTCFKQVTEPVVSAGSELRVITRYGVGIDNIAVDYARRRGIVVERVTGYCIDEVAVHALATGLALWRGLKHYERRMWSGHWGVDTERPLHRLEGSKVAVIGRGPIGAAVRARWAGFGVDLTDRVDGAHLVSVHVPLTEETAGMIDSAAIERMAHGAIVVNTSRGRVVALDDCIDALHRGRLGGLGLDVYPTEPYDPAPLQGVDNVVLTPHVAFYSEQSIAVLRTQATEQTIAALRSAGVVTAR